MSLRALSFLVRRSRGRVLCSLCILETSLYSGVYVWKLQQGLVSDCDAARCPQSYYYERWLLQLEKCVVLGRGNICGRWHLLILSALDY